MIRVALVGCGRMGRHHARVIAAHPECRLVAAIDVLPGRAERVAADTGAEARADVPDVDAVVIATPTGTHAELALPQLLAGRACLVEKPLAHDLAAAERLVGRLCVGHVERFNPAVRAAGPLDPDGGSARRVVPRGEGDVIADLMIHDLDLLLAWTGADAVEVRGERIRAGSAEVTLAAGRAGSAVRAWWIGELHLDLLARVATRAGRRLAPPDDRDGLTAQWDAFVDAVAGRSAFAVDGAAGLRALRAVLTVRDASRARTPSDGAPRAAR